MESSIEGLSTGFSLAPLVEIGIWIGLILAIGLFLCNIGRFFDFGQAVINQRHL